MATLVQMGTRSYYKNFMAKFDMNEKKFNQEVSWYVLFFDPLKFK